MKQFKVYQLPVEHNAKFMNLEFVRENNIMPKLEDYKLVYEGEFEPQGEYSEPDQLYMKFQGEKPEGYTGHSISMSDVVEIDGKYYYCDDYGWEEISFQPQNTITFAPEDVPQEELTGSCTTQPLAELRKVSDSCPSKKDMFDDIKKKHPSAILLFRCGDFYEAYEDDAKVCAKELGITLTKSRKDNIYMAGFPYHALDTYLPKLIRSGNKIAICDQL